MSIIGIIYLVDLEEKKLCLFQYSKFYLVTDIVYMALVKQLSHI